MAAVIQSGESIQTHSSSSYVVIALLSFNIHIFYLFRLRIVPESCFVHLCSNNFVLESLFLFILLHLTGWC